MGPEKYNFFKHKVTNEFLLLLRWDNRLDGVDYGAHFGHSSSTSIATHQGFANAGNFQIAK